MCVRACAHILIGTMVQMKRPGDKMWEAVLSFYRICPGVGTQSLWFVSKLPCALNWLDFMSKPTQPRVMWEVSWINNRLYQIDLWPWGIVSLMFDAGSSPVVSTTPRQVRLGYIRQAEHEPVGCLLPWFLLQLMLELLPDFLPIMDLKI